MRNGSHSRRLLLIIAILAILIAAGFAAAMYGQGQAAKHSDLSENQSVHAGENAFASTCAGCHGLDGQGSGRAPNIAGSAKVQRFSDTQLSRIISNGIPGTGMPAFRTLSAQKVSEIVRYLRVLQGQGSARSLPGDAARGKEIFFGKGECSSCHAMRGEGGFLGPDLSAYGETASPQAALDNILAANRIAPAGYRSGVVTTHDGNRVEGLIRNEDNFSIQLQTSDGSFHFFQRSEVQSIEYSNRSLMPTDYRERLSKGELDDLVNYLLSRNSRGARHSHDENEDLEEPH